MWTFGQKPPKPTAPVETDDQRLVRLAGLRWMVGKSVELGPVYFRAYVESRFDARRAVADLALSGIQALDTGHRWPGQKPIYGVLIHGAGAVERAATALLPHNPPLAQEYDAHLTKNGLCSSSVIQAVQSGAAVRLTLPNRPGSKSLLESIGVPTGGDNVRSLPFGQPRG